MDDKTLAKEIAAYDFDGLFDTKKRDRLLRRFLYLGNKLGYAKWEIHRLEDENLVTKVFSSSDVAQFMDTLRIYEYTNKFFSLFSFEHSWGMQSYMVHTLKEMCNALRAKISQTGDFEDGARGSINIFEDHLDDAQMISIYMAPIPCICVQCFKNAFIQMIIRGIPTWLYRKKIWKLMEREEHEKLAELFDLPDRS